MDIGVHHKDFGAVDVAGLTAHLLSLPESAWQENTYRQDTFSVHRRTQSIVLKFDAHTARELLDTFRPFLADLFHKIKEHFGEYTIQKLMFARLPSDCSIPKHIDSAPIFDDTHRLHVPLQTNDNVIFTVGGEHVVMSENNLYEINNKRPHSVANNGDTDRIHLIIDIQEQAA